ncbi:uncharacterized protein AB675_9841 [Cyphellophora attinorum]|uniref:NTF2-like domain-containing protein n=1 Tax=Cyphellophora attinorum TaxID=1664694 RepID=A0A0N0NP83_9EURO|nr:uncharacterized protein AB675_9841 [Phialophora attinorum]KPI42239.1 hypothetical protein AB675_9841 [Phialophora attinorum]
MQLTTILTSSLLLLLPAVVSAWSCLSDADAQDIVDKSIIFLQHRNITQAREVATELFSPDIVQYGDSINILRADPLGTPVYENATAYIEGTLAAPGIPNITTIAIIHDCNSLVFFWQFEGIGGPNAPVKNRVRGMTYQQMDDNNKVIQHDVEFNSYAWAENTGFQISYPETGTYAQPEEPPAKVRRSPRGARMG